MRNENRIERYGWGGLARAMVWALLVCAVAVPLRGQAVGADSAGGRWKQTLAVGPTVFAGDEANTVGMQIQAGLLRRLQRSRTWLRAEAGAHLFGLQPLYPCLLQRGGVCYATSQRLLVDVGVGVQHTLRQASVRGRASTYLLGGISTYFSSRQAHQSSSCAPNDLCAAAPPGEQFSDMDVGANVGVGQVWMIGRSEVFVEGRYHQPIWRQHDGAPYTHYRLFPLTLGFRF